MKKTADQLQVNLEEMSDYDVRKILEMAGVDWDSVDQLDADAIAVSLDLANAWRDKMGGNEFDNRGPKVDESLPDGTVAIYKDMVTETEGAPGEGTEKGPQDEAAQGAYRVSEEDAGDGEQKDMLPGAGASRGAKRDSSRQREMARRAKRGPRDYHSGDPDHPREYSLTEWWDFESDVSGSGTSPFMGQPKGRDKKEKKT